jgi:hypothetical protein
MNLPTKTIIFNPKTITLPGEENTEISNPFDGHISLKIPTYIERMELIEKISDEKEGDTKLTSTKRLIQEVIDHVTEVKLRHVESGQEIADVNELGLYAEGAALLNEAGKALTQGAMLGKN